MGVKEHKPKSAEGNQAEVLQAVKVLFRRAVQGPQAGGFYGSQVRQPGGNGFRETADGDRIYSMIGTLEPGVTVKVRAANGDIETITSGTHPITGEPCAPTRVSFAVTEETFQDMQTLQGVNYIAVALARVNTNALKGHGLEGQLWVEPDLDVDLDLFEAPQISGADDGESLRESLAAGIQSAEKGLASANARRHQRHATRPASILTQEERAAQNAERNPKASQFAERAAKQVGLPQEQVLTSSDVLVVTKKDLEPDGQEDQQ